MSMSYSEFLDYYHKGDYIYEKVLRANLNDPDKAIIYFLSNNMIKVTKIYRCPVCYNQTHVAFDNGFKDGCEEFVCYSCGRIWGIRSLIEEKVFRKV